MNKLLVPQRPAISHIGATSRKVSLRLQECVSSGESCGAEGLHGLLPHVSRSYRIEVTIILSYVAITGIATEGQWFTALSVNLLSGKRSFMDWSFIILLYYMIYVD